MTGRDTAIGENLTRLRGETTQQEVADAMRMAGYKWSQATVWAVEKGDRPLRLAEAADLAKIFHRDVASLVMLPVEAAMNEHIMESFRSASESMDAIRRATEQFQRDKESIRSALELAAQAITNGSVPADFGTTLAEQEKRAAHILKLSAAKLAEIAENDRSTVDDRQGGDQ
jgi:hypothetical protein